MNWRKLVVNCTTLTDSATIDKVAARAAEGVGVWHALSEITGSKCWCAKCRPDIKKFA